MIARAFTDSLASKPDPFTDRNEVNWHVECNLLYDKHKEHIRLRCVPNINVSDKKTKNYTLLPKHKLQQRNKRNSSHRKQRN